jgi:hypothetical protein
LLAVAAAAPAVALAGAKDPTKRHTAADMRLARSVALQRADFAAGWTQEKGSGAANGDCSALPDESKLIETGSVDPTFASPNGGAVTVDSEVDVYATKAMALADWRVANLQLLRRCLAELFAKTSGAQVTVTASAVAAPARAERVRAFRFELKASGIAFDIDLVALGKGRATVLLTVAGPRGSQRSSLVAPFARLLAQRLAAS